ncbi:MAG: hypothetical protein JWN11_1460 [Hyphomicrobiales bacterium]|nr:hypothetical protein [Hyphomicrobiales bacterium]
MKIIHVIGALDPAKGGPQTVVVRLAAAQAAAGHDVHVFGYANADAEQRALVAANAVPGFSAVHWTAVPQGSRLNELFSIRARPMLKSLIETAGFMHLHGVWEPVLLQAASLARRAGLPYCVRPAGMLDAWSLGQKGGKKRLALALGFRKMLDGAAFIHALNADEARLMEPLQLRAPSCVIPNGIFLEEITRERLPGRRFTWPALGERPYVLFLSRLHYKKGLDVLAAAFRQVAAACPEVDLVVGGPDGGALEGFAATIAGWGLTSRVHVVGPLYGTDKYAALFGATCFCLPSRQEGFSLAITEALACGVPAVITEACHFPEVGMEGAGMVRPLDPEAIAEALIAVLSDPAMAARMGENGKRLVRDRFTWPRIADLTLEAYRRFASSPVVDGSAPLHLVPEK